MTAERILYREQFGSSDKKRSYVSSAGNRLLCREPSRGLQPIAHILRTVFLPQGYPDSVSEDYLAYQVYDTIQAFASSITGTLATQALLKGMGVGEQGATVLAATVTWILKDGSGMVGRILFAWSKGISLDYDAKRWRLFADILNDSAICFEIVASYFPSLFTGIVCVAGVCKSIVGVAGGATRAALTQHQARRNNMADVSAKDGSQETLVNLSALVFSLILAPLVSGNPMLLWAIFVMFTALHLYANYSAVKSVVMETINQSRLHELVLHYFSAVDGEVLSVKEGNFREPVFLWGTRWHYSIKMGSSLMHLTERTDDLVRLTDLYKEEKYILGISKGRVCVALRSDSGDADQLTAAFQAEIINVAAQQNWRMIVVAR